jgi:site-specific recombinase XerD
MKNSERRYLTDAECARLLAVPKTHTRTGLRNAVMMRLLLEGGLKVSELVGRELVGRESGEKENVAGDAASGLHIGDIDWNSDSIIVRRQSERRVSFGAETMRLLREWVYKRPVCSTLLVFTTLQGGKINNRYVRQFLARYGREAGIAISVKPSVLRNSFTRRLKENGGDVALVRARLGLSPSSTPPRIGE